MVVDLGCPPVMIRPVLKDCTKHKQIVPVFVFELIAVLLEKKPQFLWEFQMTLTSAFVPLAVGGLGKVEER